MYFYNTMKDKVNKFLEIEDKVFRAPYNYLKEKGIIDKVIELNRAKLMQAQEIAEDKMEQNEDLAKLRAGVSLAKSGVQQAQVMVEDN